MKFHVSHQSIYKGDQFLLDFFNTVMFRIYLKTMVKRPKHTIKKKQPFS